MDIKILTFIIAAGGWIVVIIQTLLGFLERQKKHEDDILLKATEYFTGGTLLFGICRMMATAAGANL